VSDAFFVSDDPALLDFDVIHGFLSMCYWSPGIPRTLVEKAAAHSMTFGVYDSSRPRRPSDPRPSQIGSARMVTDRATYAYLADVFILDSHRGRGLSKRLMQHIMAHRDRQGLRRMMLMTRDAHGLYAQFGFGPLAAPDRAMEKTMPNLYPPPPTAAP
jgi:GNAT superfamily N-acetyltransferase